MKRIVLAIVLLATLLGQDALATDVNWGVATAEVTFGAASLYLGLSNGHQGFAGNRSLAASVFGLAVGITSIALSTYDRAEVPAVDLATGMLAVLGSVLRLPRAEASSSHRVGRNAPTSGEELGFELAPGFRQLAVRIKF